MGERRSLRYLYGVMSAHTTFESVLAAARQGQDWAWERLLVDLDQPVRGYIRSQGGRDVDDLAGEVWLHVVRGLPRFSGGESAFRTWVFSVAHQRLVDDYRRAAARPTAEADDATLEILAPASPGADERALRELEDERVIAALARLTVDQRQVVALRFLAGLSLVEIAQVTGRTATAVQALQGRALNQLKKILASGGE